MKRAPLSIALLPRDYTNPLIRGKTMSLSYKWAQHPKKYRSEDTVVGVLLKAEFNTSIPCSSASS